MRQNSAKVCPYVYFLYAKGVENARKWCLMKTGEKRAIISQGVLLGVTTNKGMRRGEFLILSFELWNRLRRWTFMIGCFFLTLGYKWV